MVIEEDPVFYRCKCEVGNKYAGFPGFEGERRADEPKPPGKVIDFPRNLT